MRGSKLYFILAVLFNLIGIFGIALSLSAGGPALLTVLFFLMLGSSFGFLFLYFVPNPRRLFRSDD